MEAEIHEIFYSELESDSKISENEASNEDPSLNQEIKDSQKANLSSTPSIFFVRELHMTLKLTTDALDCNNILVNQVKGSVLNTVSSCISNGKLPTKDVETRQCKGLLGYANQFEKLFYDKETQLVCRKSEHSSKQICLTRTSLIESFKVAHGYRFSGQVGSEKSLMSLKRFFFWPGLFKWIRTLTKSCLSQRKNKEIRMDQNTAPNDKWGEEIPYLFQTVHFDHKGPLNSKSDRKHHGLVVVDAFSHFIQKYPVKSTDSTFTTYY